MADCLSAAEKNIVAESEQFVRQMAIVASNIKLLSLIS
jgi:hypothetical protein